MNVPKISISVVPKPKRESISMWEKKKKIQANNKRKGVSEQQSCVANLRKSEGTSIQSDILSRGGGHLHEKRMSSPGEGRG